MLKANFQYVIVEVINNSNVSPGGIVIPDNSVKPSNKGYVVNVGGYDVSQMEDDGELLSFQTGDLVFFPLYAGHKLTYNNKEYIVLKEEDILAFEMKE